MVVHTYNPSTVSEFQAGLEHMVRPRICFFPCCSHKVPHLKLKEKATLVHSSRVQPMTASKGSGGRMASTIRKARDMNSCAQLSAYTIQEPSPGNGATHCGRVSTKTILHRLHRCHLPAGFQISSS